MPSDPRCPHCEGKVSATAMWCMHCGADFDQPVDADSGRAVDGRHRGRTDLKDALDSGDADDITGALEESDTGATVVSVGLAVVALVTLPLVSPPNVTFLYLVVVVALGLYAARQPTASDAARDGGTALAAAPFLLWLVGPLVNGVDSFSLGSLAAPLVYAFIVGSIARRFG